MEIRPSDRNQCPNLQSTCTGELKTVTYQRNVHDINSWQGTWEATAAVHFGRLVVDHEVRQAPRIYVDKSTKNMCLCAVAYNATCPLLVEDFVVRGYSM